MCKRFHAWDGAINKKQAPSWKTKYVAHFKILNAISDKMAGRFNLIFEIETHFDVI